MQFLGRLLSSASSLSSSLFSSPFRVKEVQIQDYGGTSTRVRLRDEGRTVLYKDSTAQSWECLLLNPESPTTALRLFVVAAETDAELWFAQFSQKLRPFYETLSLSLSIAQSLTDCIREHPDWSSAHIAVETGLRECLKHNKIQSEVNVQDSSGHAPLHLAVEKQDVLCVRELLEGSQVRTDLKDENGDTALHRAATQENASITEVLCSGGLCSGINELNLKGESPLHVASRLGRVQVLKALLEGGAKCDVLGATGFAVHTATKFNESECVVELLKADVSQVEVEDPLYGGTALHWAKTPELCRLLLDSGSNVNYLSKTGESPLHIMSRRGRFEAAMVLLTHGADANLRGRDGDTALHLAMKLDHMDLIKALVVFGADVEIHNDLGETPGLLAARSSKGANRKVLLDMLCSVGLQRCHPPAPPPDTKAPPPVPPRPACITNNAIGFEQMMSSSSSVRTSSHSEGNTPTPRRVERLLCLDGGGIKGLVLIQMLIALEKQTGRPTRELFDWVSGTSTGGILALAIVHGKSLEYLRCLYFRMKEQVFTGSRPYESAPLEDFLKKEFGEDTKMTDIQFPRVMVTSVLADRHPGELHLFRNYDPPSAPREPPYKSTATYKPLTIPQEQLVWRAARSSGAAPTYFRPMGRFLDGGLLANNPTLDAMTEVHHYNKGREEPVPKLGLVVSLGTGKPPQVQVSSVDVFRPSNPLELAKSFVGAKELGKMLVDCCTDSDGCAVDRARAWCEMTDTIYHRLSPQLSQEVLLDEVQDSVLVDMLWDTQMFLYERRQELEELSLQLLDH